MDLNIDKSVLLRVTRKRNVSCYQYCLHKGHISKVSQYICLGTALHNRLTWRTHISEICSTAFSKVCFLRRKLKHIPSHIKLLAYKTFIRFKLEYSSVIWDPHTKKDIYQLELVQRKAVLFIFHKYRRSDSPTQLIKDNNILLLSTHRKLNHISFLYKILAGKLSIAPSSFLRHSTTSRTHHNREHSLHPIFAKTNSFKHSFFPQIVADWNVLPESVFHFPDVEQALQALFLQ